MLHKCTPTNSKHILSFLHFDQPGAINTHSSALSDDLGGVNQIVQDSVMDGGQGSAAQQENRISIRWRKEKKDSSAV